MKYDLLISASYTRCFLTLTIFLKEKESKCCKKVITLSEATANNRHLLPKWNLLLIQNYSVGTQTLSTITNVFRPGKIISSFTLVGNFSNRKPFSLQALFHQTQIDLPWNSYDEKRKQISESFNIKRVQDMISFPNERASNRHSVWVVPSEPKKKNKMITSDLSWHIHLVF